MFLLTLLAAPVLAFAQAEDDCETNEQALLDHCLEQDLLDALPIGSEPYNRAVVILEERRAAAAANRLTVNLLISPPDTYSPVWYGYGQFDLTNQPVFWPFGGSL